MYCKVYWLNFKFSKKYAFIFLVPYSFEVKRCMLWWAWNMCLTHMLKWKMARWGLLKGIDQQSWLQYIIVYQNFKWKKFWKRKHLLKMIIMMCPLVVQQQHVMVCVWIQNKTNQKKFLARIILIWQLSVPQILKLVSTINYLLL